MPYDTSDYPSPTPSTASDESTIAFWKRRYADVNATLGDIAFSLGIDTAAPLIPAEVAKGVTAQGMRLAETAEELYMWRRKHENAVAHIARLAAQLDARDPSDELAALRRQVAELSDKRDGPSWLWFPLDGPAPNWTPIKPVSLTPPKPAVVAILLDGLEAEAGKADREGDVAMVRAIRAALGLDAK